MPRHRPAALRAAVLVLALCVAPRGDLAAQRDTVRGRRAQTSPRRERAAPGGDVAIPFTIGPRECVDRQRLYIVSMQIHNVLAQAVGQPTLAVGTEPRPLSNLRLGCGRYVARWTGRHLTTGRRLPPGVYLTELVIDGQRISRKVTLDR